MRSLLFCSMLVGCAGVTSAKSAVGTFDVTISFQGVSDPDVMTIKQGSQGGILLSFVAGITTDAGGPNPNGLRATLTSSQEFQLASQPAHIDHSTGQLNGAVSGSGLVDADGTVMATLSYVATGGAFFPGDGGSVAISDGGLQTLSYVLSGHRQ